MSSVRTRIAFQKSGRLAEDCFALFKNCGLHISRSRDELFCRVEELPLDVLLVRDDDIPNFVSSGICDLGIVGENVFAEMRAGTDDFSATILDRLGFSNCRLSIAVPDVSSAQKAHDLANMTIATSYPKLLQKYLKEKGVTAKTLMMMGSVEVAPRLKMADAICDIVASGGTLAANNLREMDIILKSEALLIGGPAALSKEKQDTIDRLRARMCGVLQAADSKYIMLHACQDSLGRIVKMLPGAETPTILPLQSDAGKVAVHAVCRENVFWETLENLKKAGASSILVVPIEKMMG